MVSGVGAFIFACLGDFLESLLNRGSCLGIIAEVLPDADRKHAKKPPFGLGVLDECIGREARRVGIFASDLGMKRLNQRDLPRALALSQRESVGIKPPFIRCPRDRGGSSQFLLLGQRLL